MSNLQFPFFRGLRGYRFQPSWLGAIVTICCIPLFIKLGLWQYNKAEQKKALQDTYQSYEHAKPVELPENLDRPEGWRYKPVRVTGEYLPQYQVFLDNQTEGEAVGYHVITPLRINGSESVVLVDRGWIPAEDNHSEIPKVVTPAGHQEITGKVWLPSTKFYTLESKGAAQPLKTWQPIMQNMDMARYQQSVSFKTLPVVIRLDAASPAGGFMRNWIKPDDRMATNISYAYQWFGFAVAAVVIYIAVSFKKIA